MTRRPLLLAILLFAPAAHAQARPSIVHDRPATLPSQASVADIDALLQSGRWSAGVRDKRTEIWEWATITFGRNGAATISTMYAWGLETKTQPYRAARTASGAVVTIGTEPYTIRPCAAPAGTTCLDGRLPPP